MKNIAKAERPKSATAILPPRPLRESGKAAQPAFNPARRDGNSFIHMVNHFSGNLGIPKLAAATTFRTAGLPAGQLRPLRGRCSRVFDLESVGSGLLRRDYVRRQTDYIGNRQATGR